MSEGDSDGCFMDYFLYYCFHFPVGDLCCFGSGWFWISLEGAHLGDHCLDRGAGNYNSHAACLENFLWRIGYEYAQTSVMA